MPGPLMRADEAEKEYGKSLPFAPNTIVYHRGNGKFSRRDKHLDKLIRAGPVSNHVGYKNDPYAHTEDEVYDKGEGKSSSVKKRGKDLKWSTWDKKKGKSGRKKEKKKKKKSGRKPIKVKKNPPTAKKPRRSHRRKKAKRRKR